MATTPTPPTARGPPEEIRALTLRTASKPLLDRGVKALVIACNTANSAAGEMLRERLPIPVVGVEPDLTDAHERAGGKRVIVFATPGDAGSAPSIGICAGASALKPSPSRRRNCDDGGARRCSPVGSRRRFSAKSCAPGRARRSAAIVLGCTHFIFLRPVLATIAPGVPVFDGVEPVIDDLRATLSRSGALAEQGEGGVELLTSSDEPGIRARMRALLAAEL